MKILVVKLSSLGDVVHGMPAVQDIRAALPHAQIDWAVEKSFAPLVRRCAGVHRVVECELRRWMRAPLSPASRKGWRAFKEELHREPYDAVIDLQGLIKSAIVSRAALLAPQGKRYALANRTDGAGYEAPTRWVADAAVRIAPHTPAVQRSRELCAKALGYAMAPAETYGLNSLARARDRSGVRVVALAHGASRVDKQWPVDRWIEIAARLHAEGFEAALPHGNDEELGRCEAMASALTAKGVRATIWPRQPLDALTDALAACAGVIGVDSGLSHIAVALDLPHVQIYNFDTAWRTGPQHAAWQCSVYAEPTPDIEAVWLAWRAVMEARP